MPRAYVIIHVDCLLERSSVRYDALCKLLVVGDAGVGKTSLIQRFVEGTFDDSGEYLPTLIIDFKVKIADVDGKRVKLQIWYEEKWNITPQVSSNPAPLPDLTACRDSIHRLASRLPCPILVPARR